MGGEQHKVDGGGAEGDQGEGDAGGDGAGQELHIYHWQAGLPSALPRPSQLETNSDSRA